MSLFHAHLNYFFVYLKCTVHLNYNSYKVEMILTNNVNKNKNNSNKHKNSLNEHKIFQMNIKIVQMNIEIVKMNIK